MIAPNICHIVTMQSTRGLQKCAKSHAENVSMVCKLISTVEYRLIRVKFHIWKTIVKFQIMVFWYNQKKVNVVHRTRMPNVLMNGCHVVQEGTEAVVDAAQLTARLQVSSPVKEIGWLKIVKQFAIHAKVSLLSIMFRNLSSPFSNPKFQWFIRIRI